MTKKRHRFVVVVDLVVLTIRDNMLCVLLVKREHEPFRHRWALPGAEVGPDEDLPGSASRQLRERTGLTHSPHHMEQLGTYGAPARDPRERTIAVAYLALLPHIPQLAGSTGRWHSSESIVDGRGLAFDHRRILADGMERARAKLEYSALGAAFCPPEFTIGQLREVYEAVWGTPLDPRNFHHKVTSTAGFIVPTGRWTTGERGRPAQLYRRGPAAVLHPPMLRGRPDETVPGP